MNCQPAREGEEMSKGMDVQVFRHDGAWVKPAGAVTVDVILIGGGGGGGASDGQDGDVSVESREAWTVPDSMNVRVGRGGRGVTGGGDGADGLAVVITRVASARSLSRPGAVG